MKLLPLTLCLALASPAAAQPASTPGADAEAVRQLESAWLAAEAHGDVAFLDRLLTPEYTVLTARTGAVRSKADLLAQVAKNAGRTTPPPPLQTTVLIHGAIATAYSHLTGTKPSGEAYDAAYVDVYRFQHGAWRAVSGIDL